MTREVIFNAYIITMDNFLNVYPNGSILIENGKITKIAYEKIQEDDVLYTDAKGMIVLPGFINTHCHIPMTMLKGYADDLPLQKWLTEYIFPAEAKYVNIENVKVATRLGLIEMIKSGTTCFNDMYFFEDTVSEESYRAGVRAVLGEALMDFPTPSFKTVEEGLFISESLQEKWNANPIIHPTFAPHSIYTCSEKTLKKTKLVAEKYNSLIHIHLSETKKEVEDSIIQTGMSPVEYLNSIGLLDKKTIAAHCVWLSNNDIDIMARTQTSISHCPKSNLKLASGIAKYYDYSQAGINVSIATDGSASNNNLNMVEELRIASLLSKATSKNPEAMNARQTLQSATINGARALGLEKKIGSLEIGKDADLILIDSSDSNMVPLYDKYSAIVYAMNSCNIQSSMVHGRWIMKDRSVIYINEEETLDRINFIANKIKNYL